MEVHRCQVQRNKFRGSAMITNNDLETRIARFFKNIYMNDGVPFGFSANPEDRYIVTNQTSSPRPDEQTLLFYRIDYNRPVGNSMKSYSEKYDRMTLADVIYPYNEIKVVVDLVSKTHGMAKTAMMFFRAAIQSERKELACYDELDPIKLPLQRMEEYDRILTELENGAWNERVQTDLYFRYTDTISIDPMQFTLLPVVVTDVPDIIGFTTTLKISK